MAEHTLSIEVSRNGARPVFECHASDTDDVETSPCRWYCTRKSCEEGCMCPDRRRWTQHLDYCRFIEGWFDDDPWALYDGRPSLIGMVPAYFAWDGESYVWGFHPASASHVSGVENE